MGSMGTCPGVPWHRAHDNLYTTMLLYCLFPLHCNKCSSKCSVAEDLGSTLFLKLKPIASDALKKLCQHLANMYHKDLNETRFL